MEEKIINNIKSLGIDMITKAESGHPGIVLGAASILYTLYAKHLNINNDDQKWLNRDRFVMSAGHGSALLYSVLYMAGYLTLDDLKEFRQIDSKTPGHPEYGVTPGVEVSTGPLGQGLATAVGLALGEKMLESRFILPNKEPLFQYSIYALCGDGDLMEGISYEAVSLAGSFALDNLIVLYDSNNTSLDGKTDGVFTENVRERFEALGWDTIYVSNGESVKEIDQAIEKAKKSKKPTLIEVKTVLGNGSLLEGTNQVHGKVLNSEDVMQLKQKWNMKEEAFYTFENVEQEFQKQIVSHSSESYQKWTERYREYVNAYGVESLNWLFGKMEYPDVTSFKIDFSNKNKKQATRDSNQIIMNQISEEVPNFITGSADLFSSVKNHLDSFEDVLSNHYNGRNIWFGIREHAMGAILNGLALTGFKVSGSTFLSFSDYEKPAMRMSSLMNLPVTYIFSHDSISIGSDGPTHQPVEQIATLRSMPNMNVYRPADKKELIGSWNSILKLKGTPSSLILSKQEQSELIGTDSKKAERGAYIIRREQTLHGILIATGDEVHTALRIAETLYEQYRLDLRVVSMPCMEIFLNEPNEYQQKIIPPYTRTIVMEAASSFGWHRFVYNEDYLLTIDHFGASGSRAQILKKYHYDYESLLKKVKELFL